MIRGGNPVDWIERMNLVISYIENSIAKRLFDLADEKTGPMSNSVLGICADGNWGEGEKFNYYMLIL
jgi:hypothetical protein